MAAKETQFERINELTYDASPWTEQEMDLLAAEDADALGCEDVEPYTDPEA